MKKKSSMIKWRAKSPVAGRQRMSRTASAASPIRMTRLSSSMPKKLGMIEPVRPTKGDGVGDDPKAGGIVVSPAPEDASRSTLTGALGPRLTPKFYHSIELMQQDLAGFARTRSGRLRCCRVIPLVIFRRDERSTGD